MTMNERDLKALYARWRTAEGQGAGAPGADAIAGWSLAGSDPADEAAMAELARAPESLAAYRVARELAPNAAGLARAVGSGARLATVAGQRVRPMVWAAAAAAALLVVVVDGVERRREHAAIAAHNVIASGSFEGDAPAAPHVDTVFRSDFDG